MKSYTRLIVVGALAAGASDALQAGETVRMASRRTPEGTVGDYVPGQVIVQFRREANDRDVARVAREAGAGRVRAGRFGGRYLLTLDAGFSVAEALDRLRGRPEVEYAEPNAIYRATQARLTPNDNLFPLQWHWE